MLVTNTNSTGHEMSANATECLWTAGINLTWKEYANHTNDAQEVFQSATLEERSQCSIQFLYLLSYMTIS